MSFRSIFILSFIVSLSMSLRANTADEAEVTPFVVVIDPGHGGKDVGCEGKLTNEKTIVLDVARRFGALIAENHPEVEIVYTRDDNRFIELNDRAGIANRANGNVFISIHVNSVDKRNRNRANIHGASVYTLGQYKSDNNLSVAMRENSVLELEDDYTEKYQGFDPNSSESYIIFELHQNRHLHKSIELADAIQHELISTAGRADRGVRQDAFWVLWATSMPAVLVELDFICNAEAEAFMNSDKGKDKLAEALFNAFSVYYGKHRDDSHGPRVGKPVQVNFEKQSEITTPPAKKTGKAGKAGKNGVSYHVQILSATKVIPKGDAEIKGVKDVDYVKAGKYYRYYSGSFTTEAEAKKHLKSLKKRFPKAFVIKMKDGKPVNK